MFSINVLSIYLNGAILTTVNVKQNFVNAFISIWEKWKRQKQPPRGGWGEHPCRSVISIKLLCNFSEITFRHGCSSVNLLHIFRTPFLKNTSGGLLLITGRISEYLEELTIWTEWKKGTRIYDEKLTQDLISHISDAATRGVLWKKVFWEILQNSQGETCARVSFLITFQVWGLQLY